MQKVVGSNPISRFFGNALHVGGSGSARGAETKWNHPRIPPSFWALMRISAWNRPDTWRLVPIPLRATKCFSHDPLVWGESFGRLEAKVRKHRFDFIGVLAIEDVPPCRCQKPQRCLAVSTGR
jgi:hypothetical protein